MKFWMGSQSIVNPLTGSTTLVCRKARRDQNGNHCTSPLPSHPSGTSTLNAAMPLLAGSATTRGASRTPAADGSSGDTVPGSADGTKGTIGSFAGNVASGGGDTGGSTGRSIGLETSGDPCGSNPDGTVEVSTDRLIRTSSSLAPPHAASRTAPNNPTTPSGRAVRRTATR